MKKRLRKKKAKRAAEIKAIADTLQGWLSQTTEQRWQRVEKQVDETFNQGILATLAAELKPPKS